VCHGVVFRGLAMADLGKNGNCPYSPRPPDILPSLESEVFRVCELRGDASRRIGSHDTYADGDQAAAEKIGTRLDIPLSNVVLRNTFSGRSEYQCIVSRFLRRLSSGSCVRWPS